MTTEEKNELIVKTIVDISTLLRSLLVGLDKVNEMTREDYNNWDNIYQASRILNGEIPNDN
jgi:hypothetical protein